MSESKEMGTFLVYEGLDGSTKSTQSEMMVRYLISKGIRTLYTQEHTRDGVAGVMIETIVNGRATLDPIALQLLFVADRVDHTQRVIVPALERREAVVCDRYWWSTIAYGGIEGRADYFEAMQLPLIRKPDFQVLLDVDPRLALDRLHKRGDERTIFEKVQKLQKVRQEYLRLAGNDKEKCVVVDASKSKEEIFDEVVYELIRRRIIKD